MSSEPEILYPAIFVFSMLLIGLVLTMWEFSRIQKAARNKGNRQHSVDSHDAKVVDAGVRKVSSL
jgi:hypothetical protein